MENQETVLQKLKRVVIKEELVVLTGDIFKAVILNQFLYWSERVKDFDKFISEEKVRAERHGENVVIDLQNGWIYKTAEELVEETMLGVSAVTMRSHIKKLVDMGYLLERTNPLYKWDKTKQYRVELNKIEAGLQEIGYFLQGYKTETKIISSEPKKIELRDKESLVQNKDILDCNINCLGAIPEITTEITLKEDQSICQTSFSNSPQTASTENDRRIEKQEDNFDLNFNSPEELISSLKNKTGATEDQIIRAVKRTKELEDQGKVRKSFHGLLLSVIETIKKEDVTKTIAQIKGGDPAELARQQRRNQLLESLYRS